MDCADLRTVVQRSLRSGKGSASTPTRFELVGAVSCAPPPCSFRGGHCPPEQPQKARPARAGGAGCVRGGWGGSVVPPRGGLGGG
eukprot:7507253-Alexandrium_andersonii.AAC.1